MINLLTNHHKFTLMNLFCKNFFVLENDRSKIGFEGVSSFFEKLGLDLQDPLVLVIAYTLKAKEQGYFTKEEWMHGMEAFGLLLTSF